MRSPRVRVLSWCFAVALGCDAAPEATAPPAQPTAPAPERRPEWVGVETCARCHAGPVADWRGSHHDLAMQEANAESVLGDFDGAVLEHRGERFEFLRRDGRPVIRTAGADGAIRDFPVAYTFGAWPLQQYLVERPGGRLHAVSAAWDARPAAEGGKRWYPLQPDETVPPGDALHWTGLAGSWNAMCAECHSTNLAKGYDPAADRYTPRWSEIDVSCEACHGPASEHVRWAESGADPGVADRGLVVALGGERSWQWAPGAAIAHRVPPAPPHVAARTEVETCAPCHSRRSRIADGALPGEPFLDGHRPALLEPGLYFADGQIDDEVYVWGSFVQSRMYAAGVTCSDCHDPHGLAIASPDTTCAGCHRPEVFATPAHHHHAEGSPGASCVACHMPSRTYMGVDERRDHGFRVPRPDLAARLGVPDACSGCHADRDPAWAAARVEAWFGSARREAPHFATTFDAARRGAAPGSELASLARDPTRPAIVRATALQWLGARPAPDTAGAVFASLEDDDPLVRMAAVGAMEGMAPQDQVAALRPLLRDPVRAVRIEAARTLAPLEDRLARPDARADLRAALAEYRTSQTIDADRPEPHTNLGALHARRGELEAARSAYRQAIRVGPFFVPAYLGLAEVHRLEGREDLAEGVLLDALERAPELAEVHHALGLSRVRQGRDAEALTSLARAARLAPESPRFAWVHAIALSSAGQTDRALAELERAWRAHPQEPELIFALATLQRDAGRLDEALLWARRLQALPVPDPRGDALVAELERGGR
ncbi:MAG: HEAT repeat domain-containing protein [Myxococcota bacterium]